MKKKIIIIIVIIFIVILFGSGLYLYVYRDSENAKSNLSEESNVVNEEEFSDEYVDVNNILISLYQDSGGLLSKVGIDYTCSWPLYKDITIFFAFASNDEMINYSSFRNKWLELWNSYQQDGYKIGYHISFTTTDGKTFDKNIIRPSDTMDDMFNYLQLYLYDDVHHEDGSWYSHVEEEDMTDDTLFTSIKITGSTYIDLINEPIKLTVFTYDSDDFSDDGLYRGNSKYEINLYKS